MFDLTQITIGGALHKEDDRTFIFGAPLPTYDWNKAIDQDETIFVRSQGQSYSCVGQTVAAMADSLGMRHSARYTYSQIALPKGGAYLQDGMDVLSKQLIAWSADCPDFTTEAQMRQKPIALAYKDKPTAYVKVPITIDSFASALDAGHEVMFGVAGSNDGWHTPDVQITKMDWGHDTRLVRPVFRNGKKTIKFQNSFGPGWGNNGFGYYDEDYIAKMGLGAFALVTENFIKPKLYVLKNPRIAEANPNALANKQFVDALYVEKRGTTATPAELRLFVGRRVKDCANIILGAWRSPFYA